LFIRYIFISKTNKSGSYWDSGSNWDIYPRINTKLAFFSLNKLGRIIKAQKDPLPMKCNKNVVYKISCKNCDATMLNKQRGNLTQG